MPAFDKIKGWKDVEGSEIDIQSPYFSVVRMSQKQWETHTLLGDSSGGGHKELSNKLGSVISAIADPDTIHQSSNPRHSNRYVLHKKLSGEFLEFLRIVVEKSSDGCANYITAFPTKKPGGIKGEPVYVKKDESELRWEF